jgi:hypothetical protein
MACAGDARAGRYGLRNERNQWKDVPRCWLLQIYIYNIIYIIYIIYNIYIYDKLYAYIYNMRVYHIILEWWNRSQVGTGT